MITRAELEELLQYPSKPDNNVLSVYLDVDQGKAENLNRGFAVRLKNLLREVEAGLDEGQKAHFREDVARLNAFIAEYSPQGRWLAVFCDASQDYFWQRSLRVPLKDSARWQPKPYLRPLIEARDEYERCGVVLTDRSHARLFTVYLNEVAEHEGAFAELDVRRFDASGKDRILSQMSHQRKSDSHARAHLKHVAEITERTADKEGFDRLVVAGHTEAVHELERLLSERLRKRYIGTLALPVTAASQQVLDETLGIESNYERKEEKELVETLLTIARKNNNAVLGLKDTLRAAVEGRIHRLVYTQGYEAPGSECPQCATLLTSENGQVCPHCGAALVPLSDVIEPLVQLAAKTGDGVEQVREEAAGLLRHEAGGIGAFLRF
jgi:peptide chain release factor subunit 1